MIYLHQSPAVSKLRAYDVPNGYEQRIPYRAILTIYHLTEKAVYLGELVGDIDTPTWDAAMALLKGQGVQTVMYERRNHMKTITL